jgi:hypothetical protein
MSQPAGLIVVFLDQATGQFKVCTDKTLQLFQTGDGVTSLGYAEQRPKYVPGTTDPMVQAIGPDGKPETENGFVALLHFNVEIVKPKDQPKIELADSVPSSLTKQSRKPRIQ